MKFFLDTADLAEISKAADAGLIDGITTNPTLLSKVAGESGDPYEILSQICKAVAGPVSGEVVALKADEMVTEGRKLAKIADNIIVKVPMTEDGMHACRALRSEGIGVNVTLCFSPTQALIAAKAGATFISPFVGRLDDVSTNGMELIQQIVTIYENYGFETEVLVASVRHPQHIVEAALMGAHIATMPTKVLYQMFQHPLTDKGIASFLADWEKLPAKARKLS